MRVRIMIHEHRRGFDLWPFQTADDRESIDEELLPYIAEELGIPFLAYREEKVSVVSFDKDMKFPDIWLNTIEKKAIVARDKDERRRGGRHK